MRRENNKNCEGGGGGERLILWRGRDFRIRRENNKIVEEGIKKRGGKLIKFWRRRKIKREMCR